MFLQVDGTIVIQLINFAIFFGLLSVVFLRPVSRAISERRAYINSLTDDYDRYQAQTNAICNEAEAIRAAARREAQQIVSHARAESGNEAARISVEYSQRSTAEADAARATAERELAQAREGRDRLASELAGLMVQRALGEEVA